MIWQGSNNYHFTLIKKVLTGEPLITGTTVEPPLSGCLMDVHHTCKLAWQEHTSLYFQGGGGSSITEKKPNQVYQSLYVVLGPWKSAMSLVCDFSENDKIFRQEIKIRWIMKDIVIYWLAFFHMTKFWLSYCWWRREIKVCWQVG